MGIVLNLWDSQDAKEDKNLFRWILIVAPLSIPIILGYLLSESISQKKEQL